MNNNNKPIIIKNESLLEKAGKTVGTLIGIIFVAGIIIGAVSGGYIGYMYGIASSPEVKDLQGYAYNVSSENMKLEQLVATIISDRNELELDNRRLESQYFELEKNYNALVSDWQNMTTDNAKLRQKVTVLETNLEVAQRQRTTTQTTVTYTNTPAQNTQETFSIKQYEAQFSYPAYNARPTYPSIQYFTTVTGNVIKFSTAKSFEQLVNDIRAIPYHSHANDNNNYAIQFADETLTTNKGDCTDKVLLLYACLKYMGYKEDDMAIVSMHSCDGGYDHNVLAMADPPFNTDGVDVHNTFTIGGRKWYIVDPTNLVGTPVCSIMSYYDNCYIIGNMHFYNTESLGGWDGVPIHGLKVAR